MTTRWRKKPKLTGLARIGASPQGSSLFYNDKQIASVSFSEGKLGYPSGWYWVTPTDKDLNIEHQNTCYNTVESEKEAKALAKAYVDNCIKNMSNSNEPI